MLIAVAAGAIVAVAFGLPVETIGTRFGGLPAGLPWPSLPPLDADLALAVLPDAASFALLGAIESLLSAVVADGMTGRRHRSNCELVAQGVANIVSPLFGGMCATGTIARTATNVRAGAHGPVAGMLHAVFLLIFLLIAAPLAAYVPLAALAAVLAIVAWNMIERHAFATLLRASRGDAVVLLATFGLTIFVDLTTGIITGFALGTLLFLNRMAETVGVDSHVPLVSRDRADEAAGGRSAYDAALATDPDLVVYRISGAFFFGAASTIGAVLDRIADRPRTFILDFAEVPFLDSTAANTIEGVARNAARNHVRLVITGASPGVRRALLTHGVRPPSVVFRASIDDALAERLSPPPSAT
jgi:SulP family sulfate permease